jgi:hypothetical protein
MNSPIRTIHKDDFEKASMRGSRFVFDEQRHCPDSVAVLSGGTAIIRGTLGLNPRRTTAPINPNPASSMAYDSGSGIRLKRIDASVKVKQATVTWAISKNPKYGVPIGTWRVSK